MFNHVLAAKVPDIGSVIKILLAILKISKTINP